VNKQLKNTKRRKKDIRKKHTTININIIASGLGRIIYSSIFSFFGMEIVSLASMNEKFTEYIKKRLGGTTCSGIDDI
jgi:hypothetical protein